MIWSQPELRVLFVCTANVCRSPLAEGLLRHRLRALDLADRVRVRSAGTRAGQRGRLPDPRVVKLAAEAGISLSGIRARMVTVPMIRRSDYVLVMERTHLNDIGRRWSACEIEESSCPDTGVADTTWPDNVHLLGSFLPLKHGDVTDIPDPYFGNWQTFGDVYDLIDEALTRFLVCVERRLGILRD